MSSYITDELNCLELHTESNEDEYVVYKCEPDNKVMGQALKKAYDKKLKAAIASLSSAQLRDYLAKGSLMLGDIQIESGWLRVEKLFNDKYANDPGVGCASTDVSCALLNIAIDDDLRQLGQGREIRNRI